MIKNILLCDQVGTPVFCVVVLCRKMNLSTAQRVFVVEQYHSLQSYVLVQRAFRKRFKCRKTPANSTIADLVKKFHRCGQVTDQRQKSGRKVSKRTPENVERVRTAMNKSPRKSLISEKSQSAA